MKLMVEFDSDGVQYPNIAAAILRSGVMVNVERALIDGDEGWALLDVDDKDADMFITALSRKGVSIRIQKDAVSHNRTDCVDCGLCISICQKQVFSFDENWQLVVDSERCVLCGRCATYCPQRALSIQK
ncbi:MAG: 4Fe-4S binding protein [Methanocorpusculum sp.]|uniref:4Fe-4S binding protein n=1 Tax=Methanocorpusculum sp. TaxID=2058474 RepID=UPI002724C893|nr:4Fe-4S binding protein [Methanocorpusculum sp.]MDO9523644.1 4Fe-4S binding protein [Methanocorpusculum sp.]